MSVTDEALLTEWQKHRDAPPSVRLEEDFDALLDVIEFALNTPESIQGEQHEAHR